MSTARPVVLVRARDPFDLERSVNTLAALEFPPRPPGRAGLVWDIRRRTSYPTPDEVQELVGYFERWNRVAIVGSSDIQYGMGRMASLLSERIMAFRTLREAVDWAAGG